MGQRGVMTAESAGGRYRDQIRSVLRGAPHEKRAIESPDFATIHGWSVAQQSNALAQNTSCRSSRNGSRVHVPRGAGRCPASDALRFLVLLLSWLTLAPLGCSRPPPADEPAPKPIALSNANGTWTNTSLPDIVVECL